MCADSMIPESIDNTIRNITDKPSKTLGEVLNAILNCCKPVNRILVKGEMNRINREDHLRTYQAQLCKSIQEIPTDRLAEPNTQFIMGALIDSQYCLEDDELRAMFVKLVTSSVDLATSSKVRPVFSNIIRHITPLDAHNLALFRKSRSYPIAQYKYRLKTHSKLMDRNVFLANEEVSDIPTQSSSMITLSIFGLVSITYDEWISEDSKYIPFENTEQFIMMKAYANRPDNDIDSVYIQKGIIELTDFGKVFIDVCLP